LRRAGRFSSIASTVHETIDENEFFRTLTLKICGNLKIEEGLRDCVEFLSGILPADSMYFDLYRSELGAMHLVAGATAEKGERLDVPESFKVIVASKMIMRPWHRPPLNRWTWSPG